MSLNASRDLIYPRIIISYHQLKLETIPVINLKCYSPIFEHFVFHNESVALNSIQDDRSFIHCYRRRDPGPEKTEK